MHEAGKDPEDGGTAEHLPRPAARQRGLFERILFSFLGPPQVGDVHAPTSVVPDPVAALCRKCSRPWDEHEIVRTGSMTYARCPTDAV